MKIEFIRALVRKLERTQVEFCHYQCGSDELFLSFNRNHVPTPASGSDGMPESEPASLGTSIVALHVGRFYDRHPLSGEPLVALGEKVLKGQHVAFLEVEEELYPVIATHEGRLSQALSANGAIVGYGAPLFTLI